MTRLYIILGIITFAALYYFTYKAPVYKLPVKPTVDMGIWNEKNQGNSLTGK